MTYPGEVSSVMILKFPKGAWQLLLIELVISDYNNNMSSAVIRMMTNNTSGTPGASPMKAKNERVDR